MTYEQFQSAVRVQTWRTWLHLRKRFGKCRVTKAVRWCPLDDCVVHFSVQAPYGVDIEWMHRLRNTGYFAGHVLLYEICPERVAQDIFSRWVSLIEG